MFLEIQDNLLKKSLELFVGKHNFQDFTSKETDDDSFVREVYSAEFKRVGDQIIISFVGNGFMRYQVRDMVATAFAVASGKEDLSFISQHLQKNKEREIVSYKAPAEGLYLQEVYY